MVSEYADLHIYQELLNRIIEVEKDLYGELAVKMVLKVKEIEVTPEGKVVRISGSPEHAVRYLLNEYEKLGGKLSARLNEAVVEAYRKQYPNLKIAS